MANTSFDWIQSNFPGFDTQTRNLGTFSKFFRLFCLLQCLIKCLKSSLGKCLDVVEMPSPVLRVGWVAAILLLCTCQLDAAQVEDAPVTGRGASRTLKGADTEITGLRLEDVVTEMNSM